MSKRKKFIASALAPLCMLFIFLNCNSPNPSELPPGLDIAVDITPPAGEARSADEFYIGETVEACVSVLETEGLDSLRVRYAMRPVGKASGAAAAPGDSVLIGGAIRLDNWFSAQFATPCTATVHGYARGASGSVRDSITIYIVEKPGENAAPTLSTEVIRGHCTPEEPCSVSLGVSNKEPWQTTALSADPMPAGAKFHGDSLFVWRPGVDDMPGRHEFVLTVTDNGKPPLSVADTVAVSVVDATLEDVYYVTYNGNGATGGAAPIDDSAYGAGGNAAVKDDSSLVREGYTFVNWNTSADGSGTDYVPDDILTINGADLTLYAQWVPVPTYTVVYSGNGANSGSAPVDAQEYKQGDEVVVRGNTGGLVRTGYTFTGWNTAADGSGTDYAADASFTMGGENITLYAKWTQKPTFSVSYNGNGNTGGTAPADNSNYEQGATVTVRGNTGNLVKKGYTFAGWNTAADGSGTAYAGGVTFVLGSSNVILYAQWTGVYSVSYNGNTNTGGTVPSSPQSYKPGTKVTVLSNLGGLHRTGYSFDGWNTAPSGHGADYAPEETFTMGSNNVVLYAQWRMNPPVITKHPTDKTIYAGKDLTFSVTATGLSLKYQWKKNGSPIAGATSPTFTISNSKVPDEGEYYCVVSNDGGSAESAPGKLTVRQPPAGMVLIPAKGKNFQMGSTNGGSDETPVHTVSFTYDYWVDRTEVTQKQYAQVMSSTYAGFSAPGWTSDYGIGDNHPAYSVNWYDAVLYCNARSRQAGLDTVYRYTTVTGTPGNDCELGGLGIDLSKSGFRLPTEAEWEYACRAGPTGDYYWGSATIGN